MMSKATAAVSILARIKGKYCRTLSTITARRLTKMQNAIPLISFTFDDFPQSALEIGGRILRSYGACGTYYVSLGLLDRDEPTGRICSASDLADVVDRGHELGCHTFWHSDAWQTDPGSFEESILTNRLRLKEILPGAQFVTMSYPINTPRPDTKRRSARYFTGCRGGGQALNVGKVDLNYMQAFFLEQSRDTPSTVWELIEHNRQQTGWLIFATHDITVRPSRFGCTPEFFEEVVMRAAKSGALILPVAQALSALSLQGSRQAWPTI